MNGAESLLRTLVASGVEVCFANPGTSEMHFVAALDRVAGMRAVLGLFEGAVTGMADWYGRMAELRDAQICGTIEQHALISMGCARPPVYTLVFL